MADYNEEVGNGVTIALCPAKYSTSVIGEFNEAKVSRRL
jgi:hypothetical protein